MSGDHPHRLRATGATIAAHAGTPHIIQEACQHIQRCLAINRARCIDVEDDHQQNRRTGPKQAEGHPLQNQTLTSAVHPHALRRTFGTLLLNDGHHLDAVADVLGHASVDTTRTHYAFSSNERRRETIHGFKV